jgi:serine/threonine protein kinase/tetratricopeptide (TPR) repeat protein
MRLGAPVTEIETSEEGFYGEVLPGQFQGAPVSVPATKHVGADLIDPANKISAPVDQGPGTMIGPYKLLEMIGEGGFGTVYVAEQREPVKRRVALKIIKLGMDTKQVIARFEAERQALALMDHPNIAKVLEAGATETGRPYFVMELVRGIKITDYCEEKQLSTRQRLDLFISVCQAIQHAHQKGIIHRDIKPSNILVTLHDGVPVPKVIDFGIAKATQGGLTDKTVYTQLQEFIGTPAYMSPEQAEMSGLDIDTRADIYSLGVLLYELLTGKTPFDSQDLLGAGLEQMRRHIREQEPLRPSTRLTQELTSESKIENRKPKVDEASPASRDRLLRLKKIIELLRGDLDWIVMKCLEKDRTRRYDTANSLAADVQRHLDTEPVTARPPSQLYRFRKLVRRNKVAFGAASAVVAALVIGLGLSTWLFLKEKEARRLSVSAQKVAEEARASEAVQHAQAQAGEQLARKEADKSEQIAQFLKDMLNGVAPARALGRDITMLREILDKTATRISKDLTNQPAVAAELRVTLAGIYNELGLYEQAEQMARESLRIGRSSLGQQNPLVADALVNLAAALQNLGNLEEAERLVREGLAMRQTLFGAEHEAVADALGILGLVLNAQGRLAEAEANDRQVLGMRRKLHGDEHELVAVALHNLAEVLWNLRNLAEAETKFREALAMERKLLGKDHPDVAGTLNSLGLVLGDEGKLDQAEEVQREALALLRKLLGNEHPGIANALNNLALVLRGQGKLDQAEATQREALAMTRKLLGDEHPDVASSINNLANILQLEGKLTEAEVLIRQALAIRKKRFGNEHTDVVNSLNTLARLLYNQGRLDEAETTQREAVAMQRKLLGNDHPDVAIMLDNLASLLEKQGRLAEAQALYSEAVAAQRKSTGIGERALARSLDGLAGVLLAQEKYTQSEEPARECLTLLESKLPDHWLAYDARSLLGGSLAGQKKYSEAEPLLIAGYEGMNQRQKQMADSANPRLKLALERLVRLYEEMGNPGKAAEYRTKLASIPSSGANSIPKRID